MIRCEFCDQERQDKVRKCPQCGRRWAHHSPTAEEIEQRAAEIRAGWSEQRRDRAMRSRYTGSGLRTIWVFVPSAVIGRRGKRVYRAIEVPCAEFCPEPRELKRNAKVKKCG